MLRRALPLVLLAAFPPQAAHPAGIASPGTTIAQPACRGAEGYASAFGGRRTFFLHPQLLEALKARRDSDPAVAAAYRRLLARADAALGQGPYSVTAKTALPPSGDRHDYMSIGPYWWPDPSKPDGMPYLRRDGEINPERGTGTFDLARLEAFSGDVETLGFAYYYSGDAKYARHAAKLLRTWFLDPATRMNPAMDFAQAVPGREQGRAEGVLDTMRLERVVDAIGLLGPSGAITPQEQAGLERWFGDYVGWMRTSANGRAENAAKNNHGMWFDGQIAQFALFARRPEITRAVAQAFPARRIAPQFAPDGTLPRELARTRSLHYSVFALIAAYDVAEMGACVGVDLWHRDDGKGRSLRRATDVLAPYAGRAEAWPHPELRPDATELDDLLFRANQAWPDAHYTVTPEAILRRYM